MKFSFHIKTNQQKLEEKIQKTFEFFKDRNDNFAVKSLVPQPLTWHSEHLACHQAEKKLQLKLPANKTCKQGNNVWHHLLSDDTT